MSIPPLAPSVPAVSITPEAISTTRTISSQLAIHRPVRTVSRIVASTPTISAADSGTHENTTAEIVQDLAVMTIEGVDPQIEPSVPSQRGRGGRGGKRGRGSRGRGVARGGAVATDLDEPAVVRVATRSRK